MTSWFPKKRSLALPPLERCLPGRPERMAVPATHAVSGARLEPPFPAGTELALFGMGCFWGAERCFWPHQGVYSTSVGYAGGFTPNPTYEEVCSGRTGHAEVVRVAFDPARVSYRELLEAFWSLHDPTQVNRQGPDVGSQYRSLILVGSPEQQAAAMESRTALEASGQFPERIATEIEEAGPFWTAEEDHQRYLEKRGLWSCHTR